MHNQNGNTMFSDSDFKILTRKHGNYASWAVWSYDKAQQKSIDPIFDSVPCLNSRNIIVGLNASATVGQTPWDNFRRGKHDRKLKYAFNDSKIRGAYMTDLFKFVINPSSTDFYRYINSKPEIVSENISLFKEEMDDLRLSANTCFLIMGVENSITAKLWNVHFRPFFKSNNVIYLRHYSSYGTDRAWVTDAWKTLGIDLDYDQIVAKYK